ncbi:uncharacterized protein TRAVEDRAFT_56558 [Trametes versicolor FP-101664 SS1]|uniref:uncharacterized protein n=1 Tax=Trametes versicolor (strain FP-101664) TaxID=717944 RepID=UPI00046235C7|nr:uncharacterized protein TRAVEDRAFT_56558 [Trametes versicolor FP-101664 SS1]EIW61148.1 hypothetical protein TRAVEDRAFT_56558 [Trametes versicolor FP-101664 SS1]
MSFINVDDGDLRIQYSGNWQTMVFDAAYNSTLHYTTEEGATATLVFTGTQAGLIGCGGLTDKWGWPSESYVVDGKTLEIQRDLTADPTTMFFNVQLFDSLALDPGEHTLVVTNLNGTSPNTFFLDNFWFVPLDNGSNGGASASPSASASASASVQSSDSSLTTPHHTPTSVPATSASASAQSSNSGTISSTSSTSSSSSGATLSLTSTSSPAASTSASAAIVGSTSSRPQNLAAIVGGAVGGAVAALLLVALALYYLISRRLSRASREHPEAGTKEGTFTTLSPGGHVPSLSMREAPASSLASEPLLASREGYTGSPSDSVGASSPPLTPGHEYALSPSPLLTSGTVSSAPYGSSGVVSNAQPTSFPSGYRDAVAGATDDRSVLSDKLDSDASPPPYSQ